jgi:DNA repair protein RadD
MLTLRPYQQEAINRLWQWLPLNAGKNPLIEHATGLGKSLVIAEICKQATTYDPNVRILVACHQKELIEQNYQKIKEQAPHLDVGIYSASVGRKESARILVGQVQSLHKKANDINFRHMVIVDECHRISTASDTQYTNLLTHLKRFNPKVRLIGLTATPYRMKGGSLLDMGLFDEVIHSYGIADGVKGNYLTPLVSKSSVVQADLKGVKSVAGEFNQKEAEERFKNQTLMQNMVDEVKKYAHDRKKILVFCSGVEHARDTADAFHDIGWKAQHLTGQDSQQVRQEVLQDFKYGDTRVLCNRDILTTGFDAPNVDCIVLLRATKSVGLYVQILGRGTRLHPDKKDCLVLDFAGNIERFGAVDQIKAPRKKGEQLEIKPFKICPDCREPNQMAAKECSNCGYEFTVDEGVGLIVDHDEKASDLNIMSSDDAPMLLDVTMIQYHPHLSKSGNQTLKVEYLCGLKMYTEYVCLEHEGYAREKAEGWWHSRALTEEGIPNTVEEALREIEDLGLKEPKKIMVEKDGKWWRVKDCIFERPPVEIDLQDELPW